MDWTTRIIAYAAIALAVASIVALIIALVAVIVPAGQRRRHDRTQDRQNHLRARCLTTAIQLDLHEIAISIAKFNITAVSHSAIAPPGAWAPEFLAAKFHIPPVLAGSVDQVYMLGKPAGPTLLRLIADLNSYNEAVDREANLGFTDPAVSANQRWGHLVRYTRDVQPVTEEALAQITPIADGTG